jgi:hypothetical protein
MKRHAFLVLMALISTPTLAQSSKDEKRAVRKVEKALSRRVLQFYGARGKRRLLIKGSGLRINKRSLRPAAVAAAFLGFSPKAYRSALEGREDVWFQRLFSRGKPKPGWEGEPLLVANAKVVRIVVLRDLATVDARVAFDTRAKEQRVVRTYWVRQGKEFVLARRTPQGKKATPWGPVKGEPLIKGMAKGILSGAGLCRAVEGLAAKLEKPGKELPKRMAKLEVLDFGELISVGPAEDGEGNVAIVRSGFMRVEVRLEGSPKLAKSLGGRVLFDGTGVSLQNPKAPWRTVDDERPEGSVRWRRLSVVIKGSITPR